MSTETQDWMAGIFAGLVELDEENASRLGQLDDTPDDEPARGSTALPELEELAFGGPMPRLA